MVIGGITLFGILPAYEIFVSKRGKEPYLPLHLFKNIRFQSAAWNTGRLCIIVGSVMLTDIVDRHRCMCLLRLLPRLSAGGYYSLSRPRPNQRI